jgi:two-component system sensor histidine kinase BaeS
MAPRRFRRRFLLISAAVLALLVGTGVVIGAVLGKGGWRGRDPSGPPGAETRGGPGGLLFLAGFVAVVGGGATALAYRRVSRPVAGLLGAAERLSAGDYQVRVEPDGPRELRSLATTFNEMAGRLAATDEQRRRFLADVTHELRTPLAVLQSGIEAQIDGIHPRDDQHLASLLEETQVLARLVDDLHTLALTDAGQLALHYERAHPGALAHDAVQSHAALAARRGVTIALSASSALPDFDVDPDRIRQVLANLLANAVRHAPPSSTVHVTVDAGPAGITFTVADAGPGIPSEQLDALFERFTRASDSRGSGLGLSIARDLVAAHSGTIAARNEDSGGAAITFTVPVQRPAPG